MRRLFAKIASRTRQVPGHEEESSSQVVGRAGVVCVGGRALPAAATAVD